MSTLLVQRLFSTRLPNTACSGRWGFCAFSSIFYALAFFWLDGFTVPAPAPLTQAVVPLCAQKNSKTKEANKNMSPEIVVALISSVVGGVLVAITNYVFTRKKTEAEIEKLKAEADKVKIEAEKMRIEMGKLSATVEQASFISSPITIEKVLYDGTRGIEGYDFRTEYGNCVFKDGEIWVEGKINPDGLYDGVELSLRKYIYEGKERDYIPRNELMTGSRKFQVSCETKITGNNNAIRVVIESIAGKSLDSSSNIIEKNEWTKTEWFFKVSMGDDCKIRLSVKAAKAPFIIQIKNLVVKERYG
ncbi:MAG: hypothetical protein ACOYZ8_08810 [Chloroflexota bacterium]